MTSEANVSRGGPRVLLVGADISELTQAAALRWDQRLDRSPELLTHHARPCVCLAEDRRASESEGPGQSRGTTHQSRVSLAGVLADVDSIGDHHRPLSRGPSTVGRKYLHG